MNKLSGCPAFLSPQHMQHEEMDTFKEDLGRMSVMLIPSTSKFVIAFASKKTVTLSSNQECPLHGDHHKLFVLQKIGRTTHT